MYQLLRLRDSHSSVSVMVREGEMSVRDHKHGSCLLLAVLSQWSDHQLSNTLCDLSSFTCLSFSKKDEESHTIAGIRKVHRLGSDNLQVLSTHKDGHPVLLGPRSPQRNRFVPVVAIFVKKLFIVNIYP